MTPMKRTPPVLLLTEAAAAAPVHIQRGQSLSIELSASKARPSRWAFEAGAPAPSEQRVPADTVSTDARGQKVETQRFSWSAQHLAGLGRTGTLVAVLKSPETLVRRVHFQIIIDD